MLLNVTSRKFTTEFPKFRWGNFAFAAEFFFHLSFDREPMAIPPGNVRGIVAGHAFCLYDQIFKNFV